MKGFLCLRLALQNIRRNHQTYVPFLLSSSLLTFALYSFTMFDFNPGLASVRFGTGLMVTLNLGLIVIGLFTMIFLFYANSFLIKRRKKELGLYGILGMERRHVTLVLWHELALSYLVTMLIGLGLGAVLARLLFLVLRALTRLDIPLDGSVNTTAVIVTAALMGGLFLLLFIYNAMQVRLAKPIDLLHSQQQGEKEPKARWIMAVAGVACVVAGYFIAVRVDNPMTAISIFFLAVILVIIGTYLLFLTGSIALLKMMKAKKKYYYSSKHFVSVSGMLYRMKQNAAGLASIAILCTMAMVTIGTTAALYIGSEDTLNVTYPFDVSIEVENEEDAAAVMRTLAEKEKTSAVQPMNRHLYRATEDWMVVVDGKFLTQDAVNEIQLLNDDITLFNKLLVSTMMCVEDYNALEGTNLTLAEDEIAWYGDCYAPTLNIAEKDWRVTELGKPKINPALNGQIMYNRALIIVPTLEALSEMREYYAGSDEVSIDYVIRYDLTGTTEEKLAYVEDISHQIKEALAELHDGEKFGYSFRDKTSASLDWYGMYGSFLFVGVFLGMVFLMGTALIIYFKQISEGYQDHDRYIILQKVGMSQEEVKRTVKRQILIVFFLPLVVALCHVGGSLHMVTLMLKLFGLANVPFIALNSFGAALLVAMLYLLFYWRTARSYLKLVKFE